MWAKEQWIDFHSDPQLMEIFEDFIDDARGDEFETIVEKIVHTKSHQVLSLFF